MTTEEALAILRDFLARKKGFDPQTVKLACAALDEADAVAGQPHTAEGWRQRRSTLALRTRSLHRAKLIG